MEVNLITTSYPLSRCVSCTPSLNYRSHLSVSARCRRWTTCHTGWPPRLNILFGLVPSYVLLDGWMENLFSTHFNILSQSLRLPKVQCTDPTAEIETKAQRRDSMDDSFHLPNFPHSHINIWVGLSALPTIVKIPTRLDCIWSHHL